MQTWEGEERPLNKTRVARAALGARGGRATLASPPFSPRPLTSPSAGPSDSGTSAPNADQVSYEDLWWRGRKGERLSDARRLGSRERESVKHTLHPPASTTRTIGRPTRTRRRRCRRWAGEGGETRETVRRAARISRVEPRANARARESLGRTPTDTRYTRPHHQSQHTLTACSGTTGAVAASTRRWLGNRAAVSGDGGDPGAPGGRMASGWCAVWGELQARGNEGCRAGGEVWPGSIPRSFLCCASTLVFVVSIGGRPHQHYRCVPPPQAQLHPNRRPQPPRRRLSHSRLATHTPATGRAAAAAAALVRLRPSPAARDTLVTRVLCPPVHAIPTKSRPPHDKKRRDGSLTTRPPIPPPTAATHHYPPCPNPSATASSH